MPVTAQEPVTLDIFEIKKELANFLRSADLFTTSQRGVTTITESFDGDGSTRTFTVSNANLKNIREVKINGVLQPYGTKYTFDLEGSTVGDVLLDETPPVGTGNVTIKYDYGNSDKIYPDYPRPDLSLSSFPRIGFDVISANTTPLAIGGSDDQTNMLIDIVVYDKDLKNIEILGTRLRDLMRANKVGPPWFNWLYITPRTIGPLILSPNKNNEIFQRNYTFEILNQFEIETNPNP